MKTKAELNELKTEVETLNKKLAELSEDELKQVFGGGAAVPASITEEEAQAVDKLTKGIQEKFDEWKKSQIS